MRLLHLSLTLCLMLTSFMTWGAENILVFGDSISSAYGMRPEEGWVHLLTERLTAEKLPYTVINASVAGDTAGNGKFRIASKLKETAPKIVIIELGGNDGLRGYPISEIETDLRAIIKTSQAQGSTVLMMGVEIPANMGPEYTEKFAKLYDKLSKETGVICIPSMARLLWKTPKMMQADGIHPSAVAQPLILDHVWTTLKPLLGSA